MPYRCPAIKTNFFYHIFNRSVARELIFESEIDKEAFLDTAFYYRKLKHMPYSIYKKLSHDMRIDFDRFSFESDKLVDIVAFSIMPTHYHFILQQHREDGIRRYMRALEISYAKRYNLRRGRHGSVFCHRFGSVELSDPESLYRVSRYVHLNPVRANIVPSDELFTYPFTSFKFYQSENIEIASQPVLEGFPSSDAYAKYVIRGAFEQTEEYFYE